MAIKSANKRLTIVNRSKLVNTIINGFKLFDIHETHDQYIFEFRIVQGTHKVVEIPLDRFGRFDNQYQNWTYRINNQSHFITADWFSDKHNVINTFEDIIG